MGIIIMDRVAVNDQGVAVLRLEPKELEHYSGCGWVLFSGIGGVVNSIIYLEYETPASVMEATKAGIEAEFFTGMCSCAEIADVQPVDFANAGDVARIAHMCNG